MSFLKNLNPFHDLSKAYHKLTGPLDFLHLDPINQRYEARQLQRKNNNALAAQQSADDQAAADQVTTEALAAGEQQATAKRASVANTLALGGPPVTSGANVLASGATGGSPTLLGPSPSAGGSGPVVSSSNPAAPTPINASPAVNSLRQGPSWLRSRGRI